MLKSRLTFLYFGTAITAGIFVACSGNTNDKATQRPSIAVEEGEDDSPRQRVQFKLPKNPYSNTVVAAYKKLKKTGRSIDFFTENQAEIFFLVGNKSVDGEKYDPAIQLFGLLDKKGKELLPLQYQKIGNPGMIAADFMELKKNGKYGLYNYVNDTIIAEGYDIIFPSPVMAYVAIGQRNGKRYRIYSDGKEKPLDEKQSNIDYPALIKQYKLSEDEPTFGYWISTLPLQPEGYEIQIYGTALIQMPSYIDYLRIMPWGSPRMNTPWVEMNRELITLDVKQQVSGAGFTALITGFFQSIGEGRPEELNRRHLVTFDRNQRLKSSSLLLEWNDYALLDFYQDAENRTLYDKDGPVQAHFLNDSIVEVTDFANYEGDAIPYLQYTRLTYHIIHKDGSVTKPGKGLFPMASSIELTPAHFKGYFIRRLRDDEVENRYYNRDFDAEYNYVIAGTKHLSAEDLEYMEMEIYARHGLKFSDVKWTGVFANQSWYQNKNVDFDKVQKLLTLIEKKNIALMRKIRKQILTNPERYLLEELSPHAQAG